MKLNNTGRNMWLRAPTGNQKLKQNAQTQDVDGVQAFFSVIYDAVKSYISTIILLIEGGSEPPSSYVSMRTLIFMCYSIFSIEIH